MKTRVKKRQFITYTFIGIIVVAFITFGVADAHGIKDQLNSWKLLPEPERLTELYFTKPNKLPTTYNTTTNQSFGFTVHNLEYRNTDYLYQVEEQSTDGSQAAILNQGSFWLKQNQYKNISEPVSLLDFGSRVKISIDLTNVNETIDYWLNGSN